MKLPLLLPLFNLLSLASWIQHPIYSLFLTLDGIVYSLVSYSYKLFMMMAQLNYNVIYEMMSPLIDRVKAVLMVFIMFKVGVSFLQYLVDPDKFADSKVGGKALVINILVTAGLLGIYTFVFQLGNDLSMAMLGSFGGGKYEVLPGSPDNAGIISRLIFGSSSQMDKVDNFGKYLAASTLNIFLHDKEESKSKEASAIYNEVINNKEEDWGGFEKIIELADDIGRTVEYRFPILSTVMGFYLIYSIVKISIEIGIRMFKLIVLQIIAPIPICSIVSNGLGGGMFKKYTDLYIATFVEAFVRVGAMYLMTGFIGVFYEQIMSGGGKYGSIFNVKSGLDMGWFTKALLFIMILVAGYKFVQALPEFLKGLFGNIMPDSKGGFGKFMKQAAGFGIGATAGLATGIASGAGIGGTLMNTALSGYNGGKAGGEKGSFIANQVKNMQGAATSANAYANEGGLLNHWGNVVADKTGYKSVKEGNIDRSVEQIQKGDEGVKAQQKIIDAKQQQNAKIQAAVRSAASSVKSNSQFGSYRKVASAEDLYNRRVADSSTIAQFKDVMEHGDTPEKRVAATASYESEKRAIREQAEVDYNNELNKQSEIKALGSDLDTEAKRDEAIEKNNYTIQTATDKKTELEGGIKTLEGKKGNSFSRKVEGPAIGGGPSSGGPDGGPI